MPKIIIHVEAEIPDNDTDNVASMIHLLGQMPAELRPHYTRAVIRTAEGLPEHAAPIAAILTVGVFMINGKITVATKD